MSKELQYLMYNTPEGAVSISAVVKDETVWLTQKAMAELFEVDRTSISRHLKNIFEEAELQEEEVCAEFAHTSRHGAMEGKTQIQKTKFYNLDAIISVGYRVNSCKATQFRIWATSVLKEYMTKGFALDDERLKQGKTAAEIIDTSADKTKDNMGLTTWKNAPDGRILKSDVTVVKNYLDEKQIRQLERTVTGYFDYIEDLIEHENIFTMEEFADSINEFLAFRKYDILKGKGRISKTQADEKAGGRSCRADCRRISQ